jgi:hypothetical protein
MVMIYLVGIFTQWSWIWPVSWIGAVFAVLLLALCVQAVSTPITHGANDNATAAGMILTLAEHFRQMPLKNTRLWLVCTGSEEALHDGAIDFFRRHKSELFNPKAVVLESLGCAVMRLPGTISRHWMSRASDHAQSDCNIPLGSEAPKIACSEASIPIGA